jgi:hypothetical protein
MRWLQKRGNGTNEPREDVRMRGRDPQRGVREGEREADDQVGKKNIGTRGFCRGRRDGRGFPEDEQRTKKTNKTQKTNKKAKATSDNLALV